MKNTIPLVIALALLAFGVSIAEAADAAAKVKRVGIEEYDRLRANTNVVVLDVRSAAEFEKGRIPGAINIDVNSLSFSNRVHALDRGRTYLVNCAVGMRSARACKRMESMGFKELYDLAPGFDGWKKSGKPVEK